MEKIIPDGLAMVTQRIRDYRRAKKISQKTIATSIGVTQSNYNRIENGSIELTMSKFFTILQVLEVTVEDFFGIDHSINIPKNESVYIEFIQRMYDQIISQNNNLISDLRERIMELKQENEELKLKVRH